VAKKKKADIREVYSAVKAPSIMGGGEPMYVRPSLSRLQTVRRGKKKGMKGKVTFAT